MRRLLVASSLLLLAACAARRPAEPFTQGSARYRFEVTAQAVAYPARAVEVSAQATDLGSGKTLRADPFPVSYGGAGRGQAVDQDTGATLAVDATADAAGRSVRWRAEIRREGQLVASQEDTIRLEDGRP